MTKVGKKAEEIVNLFGELVGQDYNTVTNKIANVLDGFLAEFSNAVINRIESMDTVACDEHAQAVFLMDIPKEVEEAHSDFTWLEEDA